jgi:PleD family two-component response regulator
LTKPNTIDSLIIVKVLIVDDDKSTCMALEAAFQKSGFETIYELNGKNGIDKAKSEKPDLILLDEILPDISGDGVLLTLKSDLITKQIPVIILSNFSQKELITEATSNGAVDYVIKSEISQQDLVNKVKQIIGESQLLERIISNRKIYSS